MDIKERIKIKQEGGNNNIIQPLPPFPINHMAIEINNTCNHDCIFCASRKNK